MNPDILVRYRTLDRLSDDELTAALEVLSVEERDRAGRFVFARDRFLFVAAHVLLRRTLSTFEDVPAASWEFAPGRYGKPALSGRHGNVPLRFNLAHTQGLVACAVSRDADVGIDVESIDARVQSLDIAERFFSPVEVAGLRACGDDARRERFIELWTLKEAYIKAIGAGLSHSLSSFGFHLPDDSGLRFEPGTESGQAAWQFALYTPSPRHRMAVAAARAGGKELTIAAWRDGSDESAPLPPDRMTA